MIRTVQKIWPWQTVFEILKFLGLYKWSWKFFFRIAHFISTSSCSTAGRKIALIDPSLLQSLKPSIDSSGLQTCYKNSQRISHPSWWTFVLRTFMICSVSCRWYLKFNTAFPRLLECGMYFIFILFIRQKHLYSSPMYTSVHFKIPVHFPYILKFL